MTESAEGLGSRGQQDTLCWLMERVLLEQMVSSEHLRQVDRDMAALRGEVAAARGELADAEGRIEFLVDENQQRIQAEYLAMAAAMGVTTAPACEPTACHLTVVPTPAP